MSEWWQGPALPTTSGCCLEQQALGDPGEAAQVCVGTVQSQTQVISAAVLGPRGRRNLLKAWERLRFLNATCSLRGHCPAIVLWPPPGEGPTPA